MEDHRAASGPVTLTCQVEGATRTVTYQWTSTCTHPECIIHDSRSVIDDQTRMRTFVCAGVDTGNHTCTATDSDESTGTDSIVMNIVGMSERRILCIIQYSLITSTFHIYLNILCWSSIFYSQGFVVHSSLPLRCWDICESRCLHWYPDNDIFIIQNDNRFNFQCHSGSTDSTVSQSKFIGLHGTPLPASTTVGADGVVTGGLRVSVNPFEGHPSMIRVRDDGTGNTFPEEGVYTCRTPFQTWSNETVDINVGVYRNGFNSE